MLVSDFNKEKLNKSIGFYRNSRYPGSWQHKVNNYTDYMKAFQPADKDYIQSMVQNLRGKNFLKSCFYLKTSGTTGAPVLFPYRVQAEVHEGSLPMAIFQYASHYIFREGDVVANMFSAANFGNLYEGFVKMLQFMPVSQLLIGKYNDNEQENLSFLTMLQQLNVNILLGTPSSLIQIAKMTKKYNITLKIEKVVFTGEVLGEKKQAYLQSLWKGLKIFSFYGLTELGFVGFQTDLCPFGHIHIFDDWFLFEIDDETNELLITDLNQPIIPLFRYKTGDKVHYVNLEKCPCGIDKPFLKLEGRLDNAFNYMGNLINISEIQSVIQDIFTQSLNFQVQMTCLNGDSDNLDIVVDLPSHDLGLYHNQFMKAMMKNKKFSEAHEKNVGKIRLLSQEQFYMNDRQKIPLIKDFR